MKGREEQRRARASGRAPGRGASLPQQLTADPWHVDKGGGRQAGAGRHTQAREHLPSTMPALQSCPPGVPRSAPKRACVRAAEAEGFRALAGRHHLGKPHVCQAGTQVGCQQHVAAGRNRGREGPGMHLGNLGSRRTAQHSRPSDTVSALTPASGLHTQQSRPLPYPGRYAQHRCQLAHPGASPEGSRREISHAWRTKGERGPPGAGCGCKQTV